MTDDPAFWRTYAVQMLSLARNAKTARVKTLWLNGAARARLMLKAAIKQEAARLAAHRRRGVQLDMFGGGQ